MSPGRGRGRIDDGMTLVELLIAMALSVIIIGVVTTAFIVTLKSTAQTRATLGESHDAQLVAAYLPSDLLSAGGATTDVNTAAGSSTGCAGSPADSNNVVRLLWSDAISSPNTYFAADYRVRYIAPEWQLVRYFCHASSSAGLGSANPDVLVVAHNLKPVTGASDLPLVSVVGAQLSMTVTDATGYSYVVSGGRRTPIVGSTASATPSPTPSPTPLQAVVVSVTLNNKDAAGGVYLKATFSRTLDTGCGSAFSVSGLGSRGTYAGPATISGTTATLSLSAPTTPDTTTTGISVSMSGDTASCTAASFSTTSIGDKAAPVIVSVSTSQAGSTPGLMQSGDALRVTFSEPLSIVPNPSMLTEVGKVNTASDELAVPGLFAASAPMGSSTYITNNNKQADVPVTVSSSGITATYSVGAYVCSGGSGSCADLGSGLSGTLTFTQADGLTDAAGNSLSSIGSPLYPATTSRSLSGFRAF
jgi:prepilin-type N-terminal cleavage/methylation domain-containing protein